MGDDPRPYVAQSIMQPTVQAAATLRAFNMAMADGGPDVNALAKVLADQTKAINGGDLRRAEGILIAQAHTLDAIFGYCARRSVRNMREHLNAAELYLRLALKAQSQCRATLETLANIKNPPTVFARQANIAHGPQQVNNGVPAPSRAGETENPQNEQSGGGNELLPNGRASQAASRVDPQVEAVGEIDRPKVEGRQG
jgi:hypothetical protein